MLKNYLKIALRNLLKHKSYSVINILGLAAGMACCVLILLYVHDELSFDAFHQKADHIYRVAEVRSAPDRGDQHAASTMPPLGPALAGDFPEVLEATRLFRGWRLTIKHNETRKIVRDQFFTDSSFFRIFDFPFASGDPASALAAPGAVVLTESIAQQLFGNENPLGKPIHLEAEDFPEFGQIAFNVTGVLRDIPPNSHLNFSMLISLSTLNRFDFIIGDFAAWNSSFVPTYVLLDKGADRAALEARFPEFSKKYRGEAAWAQKRFYLQPLKDIHFQSQHIQFELNYKEGRIVFVYILASIALFILLLGCINYMNLATARSTTRAKEIGLRKVIGGHRREMISQFLLESIFTAALAMATALLLVEIILPSFNALAEKKLALDFTRNLAVLLGMIGTALFAGLIAGIYPAFYLSKFSPAGVLKGRSAAGAGSSRLRRTLIVVQFAVSVIMIVATFVVARQMQYIRARELGFRKDHLFVIDINHEDVQTRYLAVKAELSRNAAVQSVTVSSRVPGDWKNFRQIELVKEGAPETEKHSAYFNGIDEDFLQTYEIVLAQGRNFQRELASDSSAILLNETSARLLFDDSPIGRRLRVPAYNNFEGHVVGVVKDFHFHSLHDRIEPLIMGFMPPGGRHPVHGIDYFTLRLGAANLPATMDFIAKVHAQFDPVNPIEQAFLEDWLIKQYLNDEKTGRIFSIAAGLAVLIACVGLFGLVAFTAEQRTKEIGIRKVLGATITGIIGLLSKDFARLVLLANIVAWPLAYFAMNKWLQDFAYRIDIGVEIFLLAGAATLFIALLTVSLQALRAALANPVEALRYE